MMTTESLIFSNVVFFSYRAELPQGLVHVLFHHGDTRKQVYRYLYAQISVSIIALLHEWLVIFQIPHKPNHQIPPRGPLARGVVFGGLARVVFEKFTNHECGDAFTTSLATK